MGKVAGLKVEVKSDLKEKHTAGITFTGIKDLQVITDLNPLNPKSAVVEVTKAFGDVTAGVKVKAAKPAEPELGVRAVGGPCFAALTANPKGAFDVYYHHKVAKELQLALHVSKGASLDAKVAAQYAINPSTTAKVKVEKSGAVSGSVKYEVSKGFSTLVGCSFSQKGGVSWGAQLNVELASDRRSFVWT